MNPEIKKNISWILGERAIAFFSRGSLLYHG
jgi:hypothetical protein